MAGGRLATGSHKGGNRAKIVHASPNVYAGDGATSTAGEVHGQPPYQNKRPIFGPIFDFLFCRFRLTRNVKGFLLGGRELPPNRPKKCQISSEMSANSQQMVPCRPDRRGGISGIPQKSLARHSKDDAQENLIIERPTAVGRFLPSAEGADWEIAKYDPV